MDPVVDGKTGAELAAKIFTELSAYFFVAPKVDITILSSYARDNWAKILSGLVKILADVDLE
ncbi:MAG: hypothetical protein WCG34_13420, partial [Leptolinea sp.]